MWTSCLPAENCSVHTHQLQSASAAALRVGFVSSDRRRLVLCGQVQLMFQLFFSDVQRQAAGCYGNITLQLCTDGELNYNLLKGEN